MICGMNYQYYGLQNFHPGFNGNAKIGELARHAYGKSASYIEDRHASKLNAIAYNAVQQQYTNYEYQGMADCDQAEEPERAVFGDVVSCSRKRDNLYTVPDFREENNSCDVLSTSPYGSPNRCKFNDVNSMYTNIHEATLDCYKTIATCEDANIVNTTNNQGCVSDVAGRQHLSKIHACKDLLRVNYISCVQKLSG